MLLKALENLVGIGKLKREPGDQSEIAGLLRSAVARLRDGENESLSLESRFDLVYNAAHALSLAALRWHGYRSENRYIVFQVLAHTLEMPAEQWRVLDQAHQKRNRFEYEGAIEIDPELLAAMIRVTHEIERNLQQLLATH